MMQGEEPAAEHAAAVEKYLISTIDHGFNASTFTARVITSTGRRPRRRGRRRDRRARRARCTAARRAARSQMLDEIGTADRAEPWLRDAVERGDRLMGFGHRVYKTDDPRSLMLREVADQLGGEKMELARHIEATAIKVLDELKPGRRLYTNVEFYAGIVMDRCGIPRELFTPTFAASRVIGWCTHILEQAADNRLIRPSAHYVGPPPPQPVPDIHAEPGSSMTKTANGSRGSTSSSARAYPACSVSCSIIATADEVVGHIDVSAAAHRRHRLPVRAGGRRSRRHARGRGHRGVPRSRRERELHDHRAQVQLPRQRARGRARRRPGRAGARRPQHTRVGRDGHQRDRRPHDRPVPQHPDDPAPALTIPRPSDAALTGRWTFLVGNTERVELGPDLVDDVVDRVIGAVAGDVDGPLGEHVAETVELLRRRGAD